MKRLSLKKLQSITGGKKWSAWQCFITNINCANTWDGNVCLAYDRYCR